MSALDDIAWLLNLRGTDIESNPVFFAYIIITQKELDLYLLKSDRYDNRIYNHFYKEGITVNVKEYNNTLNGIINVVSARKLEIYFREISINLCFFKFR